jgi:hypothetical protein
VGYAEFAMQINDSVAIELTNVKVIPSDGYHALLGCDVILGDGKTVKTVKIDCEETLVWSHLSGCIQYVSKLMPISERNKKGGKVGYVNSKEKLPPRPELTETLLEANIDLPQSLITGLEEFA